MPVYEYLCNACKSKVEIYMQRVDSKVPLCPKCKSDDMRRIFSTFMMQKSYKDVYDSILSDSQLTRGLMNNDPRALAEWNKKMSGGEPVAPEFQETMGRMEKGELPAAPVDGGSSSPGFE
jgi:putative FmdB family regulatory protein